MANYKKTLLENEAGLFFVDESCINCGVSRHFAPEVFGDSGTHAFVKQQPQNEQDQLAAQQALLACPVAAIGMREKIDLTAAKISFPIPLSTNIFINGFNHRKSWGAHSYFVISDNGNWLVDSPRFTPELIRKFEQMGGIRYIYLTHRDDVADAHRYAAHFDASRIIHRFDSVAQEDAEIVLEGESVHEIGSGKIHFTPGHTRGHTIMLWDNKYLFSGDHFAWIPDENRFAPFRNACWYSWEKQIESVKKMQDFDQLEWVLPGHGKWHRVKSGQFPEIVRLSVEWMQSVK